MATLEPRSVKFAQPVACRCGRLLTRNDVRGSTDRIELVCSACHASVAEIECAAYGEKWPWD